jgi:hypothetical protein
LTLSRQTADITLSSDSGNLRVRCSFIGDFLQKIYISDVSGEIIVNSKGTSVVDDAKSFLQHYQTYTQDSIYGNLQSVLDTVSANKNITKVVGDIKLDVRVYNQASTEFTWTYVDANGVLAPAKSVSVAYEYGSLKYFVNNWQLYTVAGSPQISSKQAVDLALDTIAKFSYNTTVSGENVSVSGFKVASIGDVSLCYLNYKDTDSARSNAPFVLYPSWFVPLGFDKFYPGSISGVYVRLWADTGKLCDIVPMVVDSAGVESSNAPFEGDRLVDETAGVAVDSSSDEQVYASLVVVPVVLVVVGFCLSTCWHRDALFFRFKSPSSRGFVKPWSVLLCALMLAGSVFVFAPPAQAFDCNNAGALIFGSQNDQTVDWITVDGEDVYFDELGAVDDVTSSVYASFSGYDGRQKYFAPPFTRNQMLSAISTAESTYDSIAVLYLGHKNGSVNTYWVEGSGDNKIAVTADDIDSVTSGKTFFVWSWTCDSATSSSSGLPVAWTNNQLNDGSRCYIGFQGASPALSAASFQSSTGLGKDFITQFYYYALSVGYSVQDSLNEASWDVFDTAFGNSPLNGGEFETYWPKNYPPNGPWAHWESGYMHVYGNVHIKLHPLLTISARDNYNNQLYPTFYVNGQPVSTGSGRVGPGTYAFDVSGLTGYTFSRFYFDYGSSSAEVNYKPRDQTINTDCVLTVYYNGAPTYHTLSVSYTDGGYTEPYGNVQCVSGTYSPYVYAYADEGYDFVGWYLGGGYAGNYPNIAVYMDGDKTLQAVFTERPPRLTVQAYEGYYDEIEVAVDVSIDYEYIGVTPASEIVSQGGHYVEVQNSFWDSWLECYVYFQYFSGDFGVCYDNPMYIYVNSDTAVKATYAT